MTRPRVIDSSAWIEHLTDGPKAARVEKYLDPLAALLLPSIVLYEVYKKIKARRGEETALECIVQMSQAKSITLDENLALHAADLSLSRNLPMADAIVYASALAHEAELITLDEDFRSLPGAVVL